MRFLTAAALLGSYTSRNHITPEESGVIDLAASAEETPGGNLGTVQAMAVKGFAQVSGPLQYVKAREHFAAAGEPVFADDYVQVTAEDAKRLVAAGRADLATDEEVTAAQKAAKK